MIQNVDKKRGPGTTGTLMILSDNLQHVLDIGKLLP